MIVYFIVGFCKAVLWIYETKKIKVRFVDLLTGSIVFCLIVVLWPLFILLEITITYNK